MDTTREKSRTYEEIRDKYFYLVYRIHERYGLDEDGLSELTIRYCEFIHENLHRDWQWSGRLQGALVNRAKKLLKEKELGAVVAPLSLEGLKGTPDEDSTCALEEIEDTVVGSKLQNVLSEVLDTLTPREAGLLRLRYFDNMTLQECAPVMGCGKERVRQIEQKAFRKLQHPSRSQYVRPFLYIDGVGVDNAPPKVRTFFRYDTQGSAAVLEVCGDCEHTVASFQSAVPVKFEVHMVAVEQYVIQVSVSGTLGYIRDGDLRVVNFEHATRYSNSSVPLIVAEHMSLRGRMPDTDGCFKW